jgi:TetR/AcrR family transcriptional regulator, acrAB operon repressor
MNVYLMPRAFPSIMVRRTKADALSTRRQILDAAEAVFRARGVSRTSLQDVAAAAGVTRGAIYWHFKDKSEVFLGMMSRVCLPCEDADVAALSGMEGDALAQLTAMALEPLGELQQDAHLRQVFHIAMHCTEYTDELAPVRQQRLQAVRGYQAMMVALLERARRAGQLKPGLALASAAAGLYALVDGLMRHGTLAEGTFDLTAVGPVAVQTYIDGLRAQPQGATGGARASTPAAPGTPPQKSPTRRARST